MTPRRAAVAIATVFAVVTAGAAFAQGTKPAPPAPPAPAPKPAAPPAAAPAPPSAPASTEGVKEPAAIKIIDEMVTAYSKLDSLSTKIDFTAKQGDEVQQSVSETLVFARPNKIKITTTESKSGTTLTVVSDGKNLHATNSRMKTEYRKREALADGRNVQMAMGAAHAGFPVIGFLLTGGDAVRQIVPRQAALKVGADDKRGGVDVQTVVASLGETADAPKLTFFIGKADHLLRAIEVSATQQGKPSTVAETYSDVKANSKPADAAFAFTPEPGAKEVTDAPAPAPAAPAGTAPAPAAPAPAPAAPAPAPATKP